MLDKTKVWVFFPAFNEAGVIAPLIKRTFDEGFENIVVVDDGSADGTSEVALNAGASILKLCVNRGVGAAFQTAFYYARKKDLDYMVILDSDGQHFPEDIMKLCIEMEKNGSDVVIGSRFIENRASVPLIRQLFNQLANMLTRIGSTTQTDSQSGFRLFNKKAIQSIHLELDDYSACSEMIWKIQQEKLKLTEASIRVVYNEYSMKKGQSFIKGIVTGLNLIKNLIR